MVKRDLIKNVILLASLLFGLLAVRFYFFEPVTIQSSMANAYLKEKDLIVAVKGTDLSYGDFVLYKVDNKEYVGRLIAKENDTVTYMDDVFYRNEAVVEEAYLSGSHFQEYYTQDFSIATLTNGEYQAIPAKYYLILNDDRTNLEDSRTFGLIAQDQVVGRLTFRLSPLSEFGFIDTGIVQQ
ncbi:signal peptidase I [Streptococcus suis]|uniref:Signal peptidase I n=1 Tax=Streptococcus suivaginalis TaxID=3028082 RepID=A0AA96VEI5_9STRE|nr:signal peptidase I [Streptococcus sp. 29896]MCK4026996.1 signal peptidase I [Streptococcus suis]WNY47801.1 signal peptidase I [Streptococcus sp. 29896]